MTQTTKPKTEGGAETGLAFAVFNEIGIINQLSTAMLAHCLPDGVHPSHFGIVNHLVRTGEGKTPLRIARAMQVTKNTMTHSLKVLQGHGFITVEPNPEDARGKLVYLTEKGRNFREDAIARAMQVVSEILQDKQLDAMGRIHDDLVTLRKHLDQNRLR